MSQINLSLKVLSCGTNKNLSDQEVIFAVRPENLKINSEGNIKIKIDLIEKLGADSIIYGFDKANNYICFRENGNTNIRVNEEIVLEVEKNQYHLFDMSSKKRLN